MSTKPNPGSKEAREQGCLCPVLDNEHGKGYLGDGKQFGFVINENCPLHAPTTEEKTNIFLEQFKNAMKRFKHNQEDVGNILGISRSSVSRILQGKQSNLATKLMKEIRLYTRYGKIPKEELTTQKDLDQLGETMTKPTYSKEAIEFTKVHYIRNDERKPIGCLVATLVPVEENSDSPYMVAIGLAMCNTKHDAFVKKTGKELATTRAKEHWKEYTFINYQTSEYQDVHTEVFNFIQECIAYYKNKSIIFPKILFSYDKH